MANIVACETLGVMSTPSRAGAVCNTQDSQPRRYVKQRSGQDHFLLHSNVVYKELLLTAKCLNALPFHSLCVLGIKKMSVFIRP
jgi:hypothetical protein